MYQRLPVEAISQCYLQIPFKRKLEISSNSELQRYFNRQMTKSAHEYVKITESAHISYLITGTAHSQLETALT